MSQTPAVIERPNTSVERPFDIYGRADPFCRLIDRRWTPSTYVLLFLAYAILCFGSSFWIASAHNRVGDFFKERDWVLMNAVLAPCFVVLAANFCSALPRLYEHVRSAGDIATRSDLWERITSNLQRRLEGRGSWRTPVGALILGILLSVTAVWSEPSWKGLPAVRSHELSAWAFAWMRIIVTLHFYVIICVTLRVAAIADAVSQLLREPLRLRFGDPDKSCGLQPVAVIWFRMWLLVVLGGVALLVYVLPGLGNGISDSLMPSLVLICIYLWFLLKPVLYTFMSARRCLLQFRDAAYRMSTTEPVQCWKWLHWNYNVVPPFLTDSREHWDELQEKIDGLPTMPTWWPRALVSGILALLGGIVALLEILKALEKSTQ